MGMIDVLKAGGFLSIFMISIISFAILFASDNGSDISLGDNDDYKFANLNSTTRSTVNEFETNANTSRNILLKTTLESGDENAGGGGQFKIGPYTAGKMIVSGFGNSFDVIFGEENEFSFIKTVFVSIFVFILGYFVVKAWLGRDPN